MTMRTRRWEAPPQAGVVELRIRGHSDRDLQDLIERMRVAGITVWHTKDYVYKHDNGSVCRYLTADLRHTETP
jgi:hypothetical protein